MNELVGLPEILTRLWQADAAMAPPPWYQAYGGLMNIGHDPEGHPLGGEAIRTHTPNANTAGIALMRNTYPALLKLAHAQVGFREATTMDERGPLLAQMDEALVELVEAVPAELRAKWAKEAKEAAKKGKSAKGDQ